MADAVGAAHHDQHARRARDACGAAARAPSWKASARAMPGDPAHRQACRDSCATRSFSACWLLASSTSTRALPAAARNSAALASSGTTMAGPRAGSTRSRMREVRAGCTGPGHGTGGHQLAVHVLVAAQRQPARVGKGRRHHQQLAAAGAERGRQFFAHMAAQRRVHGLASAAIGQRRAARPATWPASTSPSARLPVSTDSTGASERVRPPRLICAVPAHSMKGRRRRRWSGRRR